MTAPTTPPATPAGGAGTVAELSLAFTRLMGAATPDSYAVVEAGWRINDAIAELLLLRAERSRHAAVVAAAREVAAQDTGFLPVGPLERTVWELARAVRLLDAAAGDGAGEEG